MSRPQSDNLTLLRAFEVSGLSGRTALVLATWFGTGLVPVAPGTLGTLGAVPLVLLSRWLGGWSGLFFPLVVTITAIWASDRAGKILGRTDPPEVVMDEVAGFLVTMFLLPASLLNMAIGFVLFRFFDIVKPWPIRRAEGLRGGYGIVADDLLAGVYAHLCLRGILFFGS
ncbi:MAG TPA: phosphatidylglycerophosphatase A [Deltaproteobacteria bacterium]|nr:phosphatidylglycerophosphatase A [Deltaproteobacteria bacterium]